MQIKILQSRNPLCKHTVSTAGLYENTINGVTKAISWNYNCYCIMGRQWISIKRAESIYLCTSYSKDLYGVFYDKVNPGHRKSSLFTLLVVKIWYITSWINDINFTAFTCNCQSSETGYESIHGFGYSRSKCMGLSTRSVNQCMVHVLLAYNTNSQIVSSMWLPFFSLSIVKSWKYF